MLNRIPIRIMIRNKSQFLGIIILVFFSSLMYALFSILVTNIDMNYKNFIERYSQESFHFITLSPINVDEISKKYSLEIEERFSWDYDLGDKTLRIFSISSRVNKPLISKGALPKSQEIAIDPNFAQANNLKIGDKFSIQGKIFKISGYLYLPDYIYIIKNEQDMLPDPIHFGIGIMNLEDLKSFIPYTTCHYYMARGKVNDFTQLKEELNSRYKLLVFQEKWDNFRIIVTEKKMENTKPMAYVISGFVLIISSVLLFIVLARLIDSMHTEIGTLYALGYSHREISKVYLQFPFYIWLLGAIPGGLIGYYLSDPLIKFYVSFLNVPVVDKLFPVKELLIAIFSPAIFMISAGYLAIKRLLKMSVLEVIRGEAEKSFTKRYRMSFLNGLSFKRRLMLKQGFLHLSRETVLIFGVTFATLILLYGFAGGSALNNLINDTYTNILKYNYVYIFNNYQRENKYGNAERFSMLSFNFEGTKANVIIYGIEKDSKMVSLRGDRGELLTLDGFVITRSLADKFNLRPGDTISLVSKIDSKRYTLKIDNIADVYIGNSGYMSLDKFNQMFGLEKDSFLGLYSFEKLDIPKEKIISSMDKDYLIKVFKDNAESIDRILQVMYFMSFFLSLTIIYVLSSLTITENRKSIGIFKILGYYDRELSYIFLGFNNISFLLGFLLGIPMFNMLVRYIMNAVLRDVDFSMNMRADIKNILITFIVLLIAFTISRYLGRRRIYSISPGIILKEQAE